MPKFSYTSYCWSIGTTSFRTKDFNRKIEEQLGLMQEFRRLPENIGRTWESNKTLQTDYYRFMQEKGFLEGEAGRPDKDAREKTSGLKDIGLLNEERTLTEAGEALLRISESGNFKPDNALEIPRDSFVYFKQLLKLSMRIDGHTVRPFVVTLFFLSELSYLSFDEFTYLLPLCINNEIAQKIAKGIKACRNGKTHIDALMEEVLLSKSNYQEALRYFLKAPVTEQVIVDIGMNRKSGKYDLPYYSLYRELHEIVRKGKNDVLPLYEATGKVKTSAWWRKALFRSTARTVIKREGRTSLNEIPLLSADSENSFRTEFFKLLHIFKAKATLGDYFDLNRRYMKATDVLLFDDSKVRLDILPSCYVEDVKKTLGMLMYAPAFGLERDIALDEINPGLAFEQNRVYENLSSKLGHDFKNVEDAKLAIEDERYSRFNKLIDQKFSPPVLIEIFGYFERREDDKLRNMITDNADIPTLFEYCLGVAWYIISGRKGRALDYMNLSLESDLLPKTHAGGGEADILWHYEACEAYPQHTLLIEATLAEKKNQRRMEMEPVSRHLGEYILAHKGEDSYCVFVTTTLALQVIADFRGHKQIGYWKMADDGGEQFVKELKIIPLETSAIKSFLHLGLNYEQLYGIFDRAHKADLESPRGWYDRHIVRETEEKGSYKVNTKNTFYRCQPL